ncbi:hypothetical protein PIB30_061510 [Stylosanthes scabra]|uniref:Uncharacterized protein n=1 Tax=Stylosanthes scabra TaxID=79078 RepID=A0ABU6ULE5_9FABA|nr:hypothetical protein [Stylosanthes scabra]
MVNILGGVEFYDHDNVVSDCDFNDIVHQGMDYPMMVEPYVYEQQPSSWHQSPPPYYECDQPYGAYQPNGYGDAYHDCEPLQPPYLYEPHPQHFSPPQYSQTTSYHQQTPPWDPNSYPPYHQPYEPIEPSHFEPPPSYPPSKNAYPYERSFQSPPFNQPSSSSQPTIEEALQPIYQEHKKFWDFQRRMEAQLSTITDLEEAFEKVDEQEMKVEAHACEEVSDNEQGMEVEEACKVLEFDEQESKGVKITLTHPLGTSLTNLPSNTSFEWVSLPCMNFLGPHQYALLKTDGQLRALCRLKDNEELKVGWQQETRLKNKIISRLEVQGWCKAKLNGFPTRSRSSMKHLESWLLQTEHEDQQENGLTHKIWDLEIYFNNQQHWRALACFKNFLSLVLAHWNPMNHTKFKHWWGFKDEFKHKPP